MNKDQLNQKLISIAKAILEEKVRIIVASRELADYNYNMDDKKGLLNIFRSIDSDTDHFPIGEVRQNWDKKALAREDIKMKAYEEDVKDEVKQACKKLIEELGKP